MTKGKENAYAPFKQLNLIALDSEGRKFTNCTSLGVEFEAKGEGLRFDDSTSTFESIAKSLQTDSY